jgi:hypothetical protein
MTVLAVVMETDSGWMRHGEMGKCGENATHHWASLWAASSYLWNLLFQPACGLCLPLSASS